MSQDIQKHRPLIQLLLRLMGVFFCIDGTTGLISYGIDVVYHYQLVASVEARYTNSFSLGWLIGSAFMTAAGLCLIFRNRIAMDAIFHEQLKTTDDPPQ
ncbi:hypothetical protein HED60_20865 [Planctomycetales bacterium ZRK34]|nr:hypothetical protein HED60_20865 [Planctomycetales bacterium ZRK34]